MCLMCTKGTTGSFSYLIITNIFVQSLYFYCISAFAIAVKTTVVAAEVTFTYEGTEKVRQYEAYVGSLTSSQRCSRPGDAPPYKCLIRGLSESNEYVILARVCIFGRSRCEPPKTKTVRTELRGWYNCPTFPLNAVWQTL